MSKDENDHTCRLIGAIDAGTSSTRFVVFKVGTSEIVASHQLEISCSSPHEGWIEQDPAEIIATVACCIENVADKLEKQGIDASEILGIGITNQRETTIVWDKNTGEPLYNAILWSDVRTSSTVDALINTEIVRNNKEHFQKVCGLPLTTYFSAVKLKWLTDNVPEVNAAIREHRCLFGTVDTWIMWNLLDKVHVTDVTNASRTMLMNITTLEWDETMLDFFNIPRKILPDIKSSAEIYGYIATGRLKRVPISGCLGDQQAALVGQMCSKRGEAKCTYGTGCFILYHTGSTPFFSTKGLLTTIAYKIGPNGPPKYALEGSVAVGGSLFGWLRDNLNIIEDIKECHSLIENISDTGSVVFVPAFSGLFAPYWVQNARGIIWGMGEKTEAGHIVKAAFEAVCFQVKDVVLAMCEDCGIEIKNLKVDGGATESNYLMQMQADLGGFDVTKAGLTESTAFGAALAAQWGIGLGVECDLLIKEGQNFTPLSTEEERTVKYQSWKNAISKAQDWIL